MAATSSNEESVVRLIPVTTKLEEDIRAALVASAQANDRTLAAELRRAARFYVERLAEAAA